MARSARSIGPLARIERKLRILLVEDSPLQQRMLALLIIQLGHSVEVSNNGIEALSAVRQGGHYDAILMDCQLPAMDGFEATRRIREMQIPMGLHTTIIGISSDAMPEDCFAAGMDDFLPKPVSGPVLDATLASWTQLNRGSRSGRRRELQLQTATAELGS